MCQDIYGCVRTYIRSRADVSGHIWMCQDIYHERETTRHCHSSASTACIIYQEIYGTWKYMIHVPGNIRACTIYQDVSRHISRCVTKNRSRGERARDHPALPLLRICRVYHISGNVWYMEIYDTCSYQGMHHISRCAKTYIKMCQEIYQELGRASGRPPGTTAPPHLPHASGNVRTCTVYQDVPGHISG